MAWLAGCALGDGLDRGTASDRLSAWLDRDGEVAEIDVVLGMPVPMAQSAAHTDAWWVDYESATNGQDRTRMLYVAVETGAPEPDVVRELVGAGLAISHGTLRDPVQARTWYLYTPSYTLKADVQRSRTGSKLHLCTVRDALAGVTAVEQRDEDHAKATYEVERRVDATPWVARLPNLREAIACKPGPRQSRVAPFARDRDGRWVLDGADYQRRR